MSAERGHQPSGDFTRRKALGTLALALGGLASLPLLSGLLRRSRKLDPRLQDLPGEDSIFQPRRDANLKAWLRKKRRGVS